MDGLVVWQGKKQCTTMKVPHGADQILIIPLTGEVSVVTLGSTGEPEEVRLSEQATLLSRSADTAELRLKGESALLVMYRLKQPKTVENLQKAKRAGLYPHVPAGNIASGSITTASNITITNIMMQTCRETIALLQ